MKPSLRFVIDVFISLAVSASYFVLSGAEFDIAFFLFIQGCAIIMATSVAVAHQDCFELITFGLLYLKHSILTVLKCFIPLIIVYLITVYGMKMDENSETYINFLGIVFCITANVYCYVRDLKRKAAKQAAANQSSASNRPAA